MIPWTQIKSTETFAFVTVPAFKLLGCKTLFINGKDNRNC